MRSRLAAHPLGCVMILALALRLPLAIWGQDIVAPDEMIQYFGQAHRLVYGHGPVPWEFQVGMRSWLVPGLLAGPIWLVEALGGAPVTGLLLDKLLLCLASLSLVGCAYGWGRMFHGARGGWIAGGLAALWPDLWLMAPHPLEESLSAYALVPACYIATRARQSEARPHILTAGALLGLSFVLREQLAPAIALIGLMLCGRSLRRWGLALGAAALPVLLAGGLDWLTWGQPFRSFWLNIYLNAVLGVAAGSFGGEPVSFYALHLLEDWLWAIIPIAWLGWRGARRLPMLALAALLILVEHNLLGHKEFRFIFPAIALIVPLVGVGLAERPLSRHLMLALLSGLLLSPVTAYALLEDSSATSLYGRLAARHPCLVAIGIVNSHFVPMTPLFASTDFTGMQDAARADAIVAPEATAIPPGFTRDRCVLRDRFFPGKHPLMICAWTSEHGWCGQTGPAAPPPGFVYPPAARAFIITGR